MQDDAEVTRSKKIAWNMWKNGEHDLDKIAETTLLSAVNNLKDSEDKELHLLMVDNYILAGAKLY